MVAALAHQCACRSHRSLVNPSRLNRRLVSVNEDKPVAPPLNKYSALWTAKAIPAWKHCAMLKVTANRVGEERLNVWALGLELMASMCGILITENLQAVPFGF